MHNKSCYGRPYIVNLSKNPSDGSFLFQIEVLVSGETNGIALERLLHLLNNGDIVDYRVKSGIRLGAKIDQAVVAAGTNKEAADIDHPPAPTAPPPDQTCDNDDMESQIARFIKSNKLLRLNINKGRGIKLSIPCRIISYDSGSQQITVYHVDEKQVYSFQLNEIDDYESS